MKIDKLSLGKSWIVLSCISLLLSGLLALVITFAKMPILKQYIQNIEIIRWSLVVHVNLAMLVWFTSFPLGLVHLSNANNKESVSVISIVGFVLSVLGILLMVTAFPGPLIEIIMSNYIPMVTHPRFYLGVGLYVTGVLLNYLSPQILLPQKSENETIGGIEQSRFGLWVGVIFFIFAIIAFLFSFYELSSMDIGARAYFENLMWGSGHLLQHSSMVFLVVCWVLLLTSMFNRCIFSRSDLFKVFGWLGLPILFVPILLWYSVFSLQFRTGFTSLMQFGIAPPVLFFIGLTIFKVKKEKLKLSFDYKSVALLMSVILIIMGFVFGASIRGSDMRVPGHYHAAIGSITIGFMALSYFILAFGGASKRWITRSMWAYGIGQIMFSSGMFTAGFFGMGRKTYGAEHSLENTGQIIGFVTMGTGGLVAFAGGLFFAFAISPHLMPYFSLNSFQNLRKNLN